MLAPDYSAAMQRRVIQQPVAQGVAAARTSAPSPTTASPRGKGKIKITNEAESCHSTAEQVLGIRQYGSAREFCIRWQGLETPLWIARRKAPPQAKELIDLYKAELRARGNQGATNPTGKKKTSRNGAAGGADAEFYAVDHIVNHRLFNKKREYLVRWENYDESEDTWEKAEKLRVDVPDIVDAYEEQLHRNRARAEAVQSAMSELNRDGGSKPTTKKRSIGECSNENSSDKGVRQLSASRDQTDDDRSKEKRRRIATNEENEINDADEDNASENDHQFEMEEAELDEYSDEEFADRLNN
ncbi:Chromo domain [Phytophthora cactorum]|nr:Chromo domain [Phytophthora cactorum]